VPRPEELEDVRAVRLGFGGEEGGGAGFCYVWDAYLYFQVSTKREIFMMDGGGEEGNSPWGSCDRRA
jgi:hypothetical protein